MSWWWVIKCDITLRTKGTYQKIHIATYRESVLFLQEINSFRYILVRDIKGGILGWTQFIDKDNMFGPPCRRSHGSIALRQVLAYVIKHSGKRKSRNICDVYPLAVKGIQYAKNYATCDYQHGFNSFLLYLHLWYIQSWQMMILMHMIRHLP